ncbi:unnamed protein product, partial [marine sediment metagenome]
LAAGVHTDVVVDLEVVTGDYIGIYVNSKLRECSSSGGGLWYLAGNQTECADAGFTHLSNRDPYIYGAGAESEKAAAPQSSGAVRALAAGVI